MAMNDKDTANASLAKLRAAADEGSPLAKVADMIASMSARLDRLEASAVEMQKTRPARLLKV